MSRVLSVAWRDFKYTVLTKAFIFAVIGLPIIMLGVMAIAVLIMKDHQPPPLIGVVAVMTSNESLVQTTQERFDSQELDQPEREKIESALRVAEELSGGAHALPSAANLPLMRGEVRVTVQRVDPSEDIAALKQRVKSGEFLALAVIDEKLLQSPAKGSNDAFQPQQFDLFAPQSMEAEHVSLIEKRIARAVVQRRIAGANMEPKWAYALVQTPEPKTVRMLQSGEESPESEGLREVKRMIIPLSFMLLLWIATFSSGQHLMMSTIEEKSNKVMEVLLSAISSMQLMTGKILGQAAVGLIIVAVYSSVGIASLIAISQSHLIQPIELVYLGIYFFMAYFMVASLMAAVGSAVSDIHEANTLLTPVMLILMLPLLLWMPISQSPNGTIATAFSFIPPAIPFAMILRVTADEPIAAWQIVLSIVWGTLCVIGMVWLAAKIFRVGVLMAGKPPTPLQLLKWIRYS